MQRCPKCKVQHFDGVTKCDCGYNFSTRQLDASPPRQRRGALLGFGAAGLVAVGLVFAFSQMPDNVVPTRQRADAASASIEDRRPSEMPSVVVTRQQAEGHTAEEIDAARAQLLAEVVADEWLAAIGRRFPQGGAPIKKKDVVAVGAVTELAGSRLAVADIRAKYVRLKVITGFAGSEFVKVTCFREDGQEVRTYSGKCGKAIESAFGVTLPAGG